MKRGAVNYDPRPSDGVRARVAGKQAIEARTIWALEAGYGAPVRVRCLRRDEGGYVVQARTSKGWTEEIATGDDPWDLLKRACAGVHKTIIKSKEAP